MQQGDYQRIATNENTYGSGSSTMFDVAVGSKGKVNILTFWTNPVPFR